MKEHKITPAQFLEQSKQLVEESVKKSLTDFNMAFTSIINDYENVEFDINSISPKEISDAISKLFRDAQPTIYNKETFDKDGNKTTTEKKLFKKPSCLSGNLISKMDEIKRLHEKELSIKANQIEMQKMLKKQKPATLPEVQRALKAINYPVKITNIREALISDLEWLSNTKNHTKQKKALLYQSQDADGTFRGGNGKSFIVNQILSACEEVGISATAANIPDWHTSEVTDVYANNVICVAEEQQLKVPQNPSNQIIDNNIYNTKVKYEKTMALKSVASFIGTTNQSLINADQTMQRRISLIKCNEDFNAEEYIKSHQGVLPNGEEIKKAWKYLLTHDLSNVKIKDTNDKYKQVNAISTTELNILYKLVEVIADIKLSPDGQLEADGIVALGNIKARMADDKIFLSSIYSVLLKYGAIHYKNGLHGKKPDSYTTVDITNLEIPVEVFDSVNHNPEDVYAAVEELIYIDNPTTPDDDGTFDALDDFLAEEKIIEATEVAEDVYEMDALETFNFIEEPKFSYKDAFQNHSTNNETDQFETINNCFGFGKLDEVVGVKEPHELARKDDNVSSMRNFVFEGDQLSLQEQKELIKENKDVINRVVFSGSKSLHARITINYEPESKQEYKWIHNYLNNKYFKGTSDKACSNPSRLTRRPNGIRDNGKIQSLLFKSNTVLKCEELHEVYLKEKEVNDLLKDFNQSTSSYERKTDSIIDELELMREATQQSETWQNAYDIATGIGDYDGVWSAIGYYNFLNFSADEIAEQIEWGKWNISKETIKRFLNR